MLPDQSGSLTLFYVHDPMCSWCWAFAPCWHSVQAEIDPSINVQRVVGGLAPDNQQPMSQDMQQSLQSTWRQIQQSVPGTQFNFDFWTECQPRRSTYPACRAVLTAQEMDSQAESAMILGIQEAYYLRAKNPSEQDTLIGIAEQIGLDSIEFARRLSSEPIEQRLQSDLKLAQSLGVWGFPSLCLYAGERLHKITIDYNTPTAIVNQIQQALTT